MEIKLNSKNYEQKTRKKEKAQAYNKRNEVIF